MKSYKRARTLAILTAVACVCLFESKAALAQEHVTIKSFPNESFGAWTHVVKADSIILYYNSRTGRGATGKLDTEGNHTTLKIFPDGSFSTGWTHAVNIGGDNILWYNSRTGKGAIGTVDSEGNHTTSKVFPDGSFSTGWTNIVFDGVNILYYNSQTGSGAVGRVR